MTAGRELAVGSFCCRCGYSFHCLAIAGLFVLCVGE